MEPTGTEAKPSEWDGEFDADRAKRTIENLRRIEAEHKRKLAEQQAIIDAAEREKLTEAEKAAADLKKLQDEAAAARKAADDAKFEAAAIAAGIPADRMAAARAVASEFAATDDAGRMTIDAEGFDRLRAEHEYLFAGKQAAPQPQVSFGAAVSQGQPSGTPSLTAEQLAAANRLGMSADEYAKYAKRTTR